MRLAEFAALLIVFACSIWLRLPHLDQALSDRFEWMAAHTLIVNHIWWEEGGAARHYFGQRMTFGRDADRYINNAAMSNFNVEHPSDDEGIYYYLSHPSLGVVAPYFMFRLVGSRPSVLGLQSFNMGLQFVCAVFIYLIVFRLAGLPERFNLPAVVGASLYLVLPATLWFHSNTYYIEIFVQLPFILSIYLLLLYRDSVARESTMQLLYLVLLGLGLVATVLSEWIGVLLSGSIFLYATFRWRRDRDLRLLAVAVIAPAIGVGLFVLQHSLIIGFSEFIGYLNRQFLYQSGVNETSMVLPWIDHSIRPSVIWENYLRGMTPLFWLLGALLIAAATSLRHKVLKERFGLVLFLSFLPVVLHHLLLLRFTTVHWYSILKTTYFLIFVASLLIYSIWSVGKWSKWHYLGLTAVVLALAPLTNTQYQAYAELLDREFYQRIAHPINGLSRDDEVVFMINGLPPFPQTLYYARRNIQHVDSVEAARQWLSESQHETKKGIVFLRRGDPHHERINLGE